MTTLESGALPGGLCVECFSRRILAVGIGRPVDDVEMPEYLQPKLGLRSSFLNHQASNRPIAVPHMRSLPRVCSLVLFIG